MNENQKALVVKWSIGYTAVILMFAAMYFFEDSLSVIVIIMMILVLFTEYSKKHKAILIATAAYSIILPLSLFALWKINYIIIGYNSKSSVLYTGLFALPFLLFDIGHKVHVYKKTKATKLNI